MSSPTSAVGLPSDITAVEDTLSFFDLSSLVISDADAAGSMLFRISADQGRLSASSAVGVPVYETFSGDLLFAGSLADLNAYFSSGSEMGYVSARDASGTAVDEIVITADDGTGEVSLGTIDVNVTEVNDAPSLLGWLNEVTFAENTVNEGPQLLDDRVFFLDADDNFAGGTLVVTGLLADDTLTILHEGTGDNEISVVDQTISYDGTVIATMDGGNGTDLTVTFNGSATSRGIESLVERLAFQTSSDVDLGPRQLLLNITDAAGGDLGDSRTLKALLDPLEGVLNPFNGLSVNGASAPAFVDLDGDTDLDAVVGTADGTFEVFENFGIGAGFGAPVGFANPFAGLDFGSNVASDFLDLDGDDDLDMVVGALDGTLRVLMRDDAGLGFTEATGAANPFGGVDVGGRSHPAFADIDGDGDMDLVVGTEAGALRLFDNDDAGNGFSELTGAANPFDGLPMTPFSAISFGDLDQDGDLDLIAGTYTGTFRIYDNLDDSPDYVERIASSNPFTGLDLGSNASGRFVDLDGDGDQDFVAGNSAGELFAFETVTRRSIALDLFITPEDDPLTLSGLPSDLTVDEGTASNLALAVVTLEDPDQIAPISLIFSASAGTLAAAGNADVVVAGSGTAELTLTGTASDLDTYLNMAAAMQYTGPAGMNGSNIATITVSTDEGTGPIPVGTITLNGDEVASVQNGTPGNDSLTGTTGDDTLFGNDGADFIEGGLGADVMDGGRGNDTFIVDNEGDVVIETVAFSQGGGIDTVRSFVDYTQPTNVELVRLGNITDTSNLNATGNDAPGTLVGNAGNNTLLGRGGNDQINGNAGDDTLIGNTGVDTLVGGEGADTFVYTSVADSRTGGAQRDVINGFDNGQDKIDLSAIDANTRTFGVDDAFNFIGISGFTGQAGQLRVQGLGAANAIIVEGDINGDAVADLQIFVNLTTFMNTSDFVF